jgi:hypothetical protein
MGQLVAERAGEIALVGAEQDGAGPRNGHGRAPGGSAAGGKRIEDSAVGNDDQPERPRIAAAQPGPVGGPVGDRGELRGHGALCGPGHRRDPADLDGRRGSLKQKEEGEN